MNANNSYIIENLCFPIFIAIVSFILGKIRNPDYGKRDWMCKRYTNYVIRYLVYLCIIYFLPYITILMKKINIKILFDDKINTLILVAIIVSLYSFIAVNAYELRFLFNTKKTSKFYFIIRDVLVLGPILYSLVINILVILCHINSVPSNLVWISYVFEFVSFFVLSGDTFFLYRKMKIVLVDKEEIIADVDFVSKKGKWLRISSINSDPPRTEERLILYDDIKSIVYSNFWTDYL